MATGNVTTTTIDAFIPDVWSNEVIYQTVNASVLARFVKTNYDGEIAAYGNTVKVPKYSAVTIGSKSGNTAVTYTTYTESVATITIDKHKYAAFRVEDIAVAQSKPDSIAAYSAQAGRGLAKQIDTDVSSLLVDSAVTQNVGTMASSAWGDITDALIRSAVQKLDEANAPEAGRVLVVTPAQKNVILGLDKFSKADSLSGDVIRTGMLGTIYGCTVVVSNNLPTVASVASVATPATPHVHDYKVNAVFQNEAFALATQKSARVQAAYDIDYLATSVVADVLYGTGVLMPTFVCQIRTGS